MDIVADVLPSGEYGWQTVALAYHEQSKEESLCGTADMKKHWIKFLCNGMKKPMGRTGEADNWIHQCKANEKRYSKNPLGIVGVLVIRR